MRLYPSTSSVRLDAWRRALTQCGRLWESVSRERDELFFPERGLRGTRRRRADLRGRPRRRGALSRRNRERRRERRVGTGVDLSFRVLSRSLVVPAELDWEPARPPGVGALPSVPRR